MQTHPLFQGHPVTVLNRRRLSDTYGNPADASTWIRNRLILLDTELAADQPKRHSILLHEYFHFVWVRLGNPKRFAWENFINAQDASPYLGEAGWSAQWRKQKLHPEDAESRSRRWREYCCESFCDTGARLYSSDKSENTLSALPLRKREQWFREVLGPGPFPI